MKKEATRGGILTLFLISLMNLVSAQFYGGYGRFSFRNLVDSLDPQMVIFFVAFIVFFTLLHTVIFSKFFKGNTLPSVIVSGVLSFAFSYGIYRLDFFDIDSFLFSIGVSSDVFWPVLVIILTLLIILMLKKFKAWAPIMLGLLLIGLSATDLIYEKGLAAGIGFALLLIGIIWKWVSRGKNKYGVYKPRRKTGWDALIIFIGLLLVFGGILTGSILLIIGGIVLAVLGLLFWKRTKNKARKYGGKAWKYATKRDKWKEENQKAWIKNKARGIGKGGAWAGRKSWKGVKGAGKGVAWTGKQGLNGVKGAGSGVAKGAKYVGDKYDWEKEKAQARAIRDFSKKQIEAEKQVMRQRADKLKARKAKKIQKKIDKKVRKFEKILKKAEGIQEKIKSFDPEHNQILIQKYTRDKDKLKKKLFKLKSEIETLQERLARI